MSEKRQTHYLSDNVCHSLEEAPYDEEDDYGEMDDTVESI